MKFSELKDLTMEEAGQKERELKQELFNLRLQQVHMKLENQSRIRQLRRSIARVKTFINEINRKRGLVENARRA